MAIDGRTPGNPPPGSQERPHLQRLSVPSGAIGASFTVSGFSQPGGDPVVPDSAVVRCMTEIFGDRFIERRGALEISKSNTYLLFVRGVAPARIDELVDSGKASYAVSGSMEFLGVPTRDAYLRLAQTLEGKADSSALEHRYKVRAVREPLESGTRVRLFSFGIENPETFAYLSELKGIGRDDLMRIYILGTCAHELGHDLAVECFGSPSIGFAAGVADRTPEQNERLQEYDRLLETEVWHGRTSPYVTDYVRWHETVYRSPRVKIVHEDMAEFARLVATNDVFAERYPRRFGILRNVCPEIGPGRLVARQSGGLYRGVFDYE